MGKLLSANLFRLRTSRIFYIELIAMCILAVVEVIIGAIQHRRHLAYGISIPLDSILFGCALFIGVFIAIFCSLYIGSEYSDGTLRNKIISGHLRRNIYLANLITNMEAALALCAAYLTVVIVLGTPLMGFVTQAPQAVWLKACGIVALAASFCSVSTLISMLLEDKAVIAITELLGIGVLSVIGFLLNDYPGWQRETTGMVYYICVFFHSVLPVGQSIQYADVDYAALSEPRIGSMIVYALLISVVTAIIGCEIFQRKDLK